MVVHFNTAISLKTKKKGYNKQNSGRNHSGKITVFHRGGGLKKAYKKVNFFGYNGVAVVENIEKDSVRNCFICRLFCYDDVKKQYARFYILATKHVSPGQILVSEKAGGALRLGNRCFLDNLPIGIILHSVGSNARPQKAVYQRSAGVFGQIIQKNDFFCTLRFTSGSVKELVAAACCTIGGCSNVNYHYKNFNKAGITRLLGKRPRVRGVAMNPVDHPHGGGEGKTSGGRPSVTPWSRPAHVRH